VKYALLIYSRDADWDNLSEDARTAIYGEYAAVSQSPGIVGGEQLGPADTATTVRVRDGSGLSEADTLTARSLVQVLSYANHASWSSAYHMSLPVAGQKE